MFNTKSYILQKSKHVKTLNDYDVVYNSCGNRCGNRWFSVAGCLVMAEHTVPLRPCFRQCSMTTKNCCRGGQSESRVRPKLKADSIKPLMLSLAILSKFALSIAIGSRNAGRQSPQTNLSKNHIIIMVEGHDKEKQHPQLIAAL